MRRKKLDERLFLVRQAQIIAELTDPVEEAQPTE